MGVKEEWLAGYVRPNTKKHHERSLRYFEDYMNEDAESLLKQRKKQFGKSKLMETKALLFKEWLQKKKKLSENSAESTLIAIRAYFSYYDVPLKLKGKVKGTHIRLDEAPVTIEDIRQMYRYANLTEKLWISLSLDFPGRIGDLLRLKRENISSKFMIKSQKERVIGKVFLSQRTLDLFDKHWNTVPKNEWAFATQRGKKYSQNGINKMLKRCCKRAGLSKKLSEKFHSHLFRKVFQTTARNLGLNETIVKILAFHSVEQTALAYWLGQKELRTHWQRVANALNLEPKVTNANGRISSIQEIAHVAAEALTEFLEPIIEKKLLALQASRGRESLGMMTKPDLSGMSTKEKLELYIKLVRDEKEQWTR